MEKIVYSVRLESGQWFQIRTLSIEGDLDRIWTWWNAPHVHGRWSIEYRLGPPRFSEPFYEKGDLKRYLERILQDGEVTPYVGRIDDVDAGYLEEYRVGSSPFSGHPELGENDRGFHTLIGDPVYLRRGIGSIVGPCIVDWIFGRYPEARRVVVEPNVKNALAVNTAVRGLGGRRVDDVELPHKRAAVILIDREGRRALQRGVQAGE